MMNDVEQQEKARTIVRNLASGWNRAMEENKITHRIKNYGASSKESIVKGKAKKKITFGTTEYKHPRIL